MSTMPSQITDVSIVYSTLLLWPTSKKTSQRHWPLWGEFTGDRWIPRTKASNAENVSIWWRHHDWPDFNCTCSRPRYCTGIYRVYSLVFTFIGHTLAPIFGFVRVSISMIYNPVSTPDDYTFSPQPIAEPHHPHSRHDAEILLNLFPSYTSQNQQ